MSTLHGDLRANRRLRDKAFEETKRRVSTRKLIKENAMKKRSFISWCALLSVIISAFVLAACSGSASRPKKELTAEEKQKMEGFDALESKRAEYTTIPAKEQLVKEPYSKKKLLVFGFDPYEDDKKYAWKRNYFGTDKMGSRLFSEHYKDLEFKLATNPQEVGMIALIPDCKNVDGGKYSGGGTSVSASKERCEVILIDPELSAVVYRRVFEAEMDSSKTLGAGERSITARVDGKDIIKFLDSIKPRP